MDTYRLFFIPYGQVVGKDVIFATAEKWVYETRNEVGLENKTIKNENYLGIFGS